MIVYMVSQQTYKQMLKYIRSVFGKQERMLTLFSNNTRKISKELPDRRMKDKGVIGESNDDSIELSI